jgi:GNAT superfamily N-acetyltransferase
MSTMTDGIEVQLRPLEAADGPFLAEMLLEAVNWHPQRPRLSMSGALADPHLSHYVAGWPCPGEGGVLAVADQQPIGAAWWRFFTPIDPGYGFVAADVPELAMGVVADWRGRGVGRALIRATMRAAAAHCHRISLSVERANRAWNLYASEGFRVLSRGPDSDIMICGLDPVTHDHGAESGSRVRGWTAGEEDAAGHGLARFGEDPGLDGEPGVAQPAGHAVERPQVDL